MRASAEQVWSVVHADRRRLADDLEGLSPEQWASSSLCPGWTIHDVLAHLVDTARTGRLSFVRDLIAARLDFDRANERGIARVKAADPTETVTRLRQVADLTRTPPANLDTRLVESIVHGEDIRRPLGIERSYPHAAAVRALAYQLRTPVGFGGGRERARGLRLVDPDAGTAHGAGLEVHGTTVDLLLAISGRAVDPARLTGPGADQLRQAGPPTHPSTEDA
ncbi:maleylpyruvate isomerase family mycothiol-dependent enzyme [Ornithinimicrobium cryptoxanthini]|uniref:Maleylpyruvate isomerase family mycothiol-dependent enzyme n=1 Tax=Ornithinimicrobium cryptoxanthini TaxID=2934161 RepID=A0ABY4YHU7_9MICO|nr:maleylpyruvate isomerase family mycothiol-dependent enzyme [Ornithinimicrobium cryptoxanthini]USQ76283.1 maleylpyruvate isomerase family mycothiol-dependent enzyme [Ornithinimicrobium cryptoxanthini]